MSLTCPFGWCKECCSLEIHTYPLSNCFPSLSIATPITWAFFLAIPCILRGHCELKIQFEGTKWPRCQCFSFWLFLWGFTWNPYTESNPEPFIQKESKHSFSSGSWRNLIFQRWSQIKFMNSLIQRDLVSSSSPPFSFKFLKDNVAD